MMPKEDIAREVYDLLARTVSRMVTAASQQTGIRQVLIAGGVASSRLFRELVTQRTAKRQPDLRVRFGARSIPGTTRSAWRSLAQENGANSKH